MMKKTLAGVLTLALVCLWACAAAHRSTPAAASTESGDRELKRGVYWYQKGCMRKALDHFHAAHEQYSLNHQPTGVARSLNSLANVHRQQGHPADALFFYDAALAAARHCDDRSVLAGILANKAAVLMDNNDPTTAGQLLEEAEPLAMQRGAVLAMVLNYQAMLMMRTGHDAEAVKRIDRAEALDIGDDPAVNATLRFSRGRILMHADRQSEAMRLFDEALELDRQAGCSRCMADDLAAMADVNERLGKNEAALNCLEQSLKIYALLENHAKVNDHLDRLERLAGKTGADIRVTLHFINKWLAGEAVDAICR